MKINELLYSKDKHISSFRPLIDGMIDDFGYVFLHTILQWCGLASDLSKEKGQYWELYLVGILDKNKEFKVIGICGLYTLTPHDKSEMWLGWLGLLPEYRSKGLGRHIMKFLYKQAKAEGGKVLMSYVDKEGKPLPFYKREGFKVIGTVKDFLKKSGIRRIDGEDFEDGSDYVIRKQLTK